MEKYDCIIIGAGVAGLFSALKLSCAGKRVFLIEKQPVPGGFATSFTRKGFTFESSLHCVNALGEDGEIRRFLEEAGIDKEVNFISLRDFSRIIYPEHDFIADFNQDNLKAFFKKSFPQEENNIDKLFSRLEKFYRQFDSFYNLKLPYWLKLILVPLIYQEIIRVSLCTASELIAKYIKDDKLKGIIADIWKFMGLPPSRLCAFYFLIVLRGYFFQPTVYMEGGFSRLFNAIVKKIKANGSEVKFNTRVKKIITYKNKVKGIIIDNEEEFQAKVIISNANAIDTLTDLLDNVTLKEKYLLKLSPLEKSISAFQVYLGLSVPAKQLGMDHHIFSINTTYNHDDNFNYVLQGNYDLTSIEVVDHAQIDPSLVPAGKGSLLIMALDNYANWDGLTEEEYQRKKSTVAHKLIQRAEKYLPGISDYIEVMEVATPKTMARYGTSPEGAIYGFAQTVKQASINRLTQTTNIKGLILAGAWTHPGGGMHACFISGIDAADLALRR